MRYLHFEPWSILLILGSCDASNTEASNAPRKTSSPFADLAAGSLPASWQVAETNGRGMLATWRIESDGDDPVVRLVETKNSGSTYNLVLLPEELPADVQLEVRVRADGGSEDQGGGFLWRAKDASNYYITRWNPLEKNLRVYKVVDGKRTQLHSADVDVDAKAWHELGVTAKGASIRVRFDGRELLAVEDETFTGGGRVGFWTKADAATSFAGSSVEVLP